MAAAAGVVEAVVVEATVEAAETAENAEMAANDAAPEEVKGADLPEAATPGAAVQAAVER